MLKILVSMSSNKETPSSEEAIIRSILEGDDLDPRSPLHDVEAESSEPTSEFASKNVTDDQQEIETQNTRRKLVRDMKRRRKTHSSDTYLTLQEFKTKNHSLYLSASQVAAMVGLHPYNVLPKLFMNLVYQGHTGRKLLNHDAKLLGISLVDEEESLREIASKGGKEIVYAFEKSIKIQKGEENVKSIQEAGEVKNNILKQMKESGKFSHAEVKLLAEGVRHNVNCGFGKAHEENALDLYEKLCGWEVRERNAEFKYWKFVKSEDAKDGSRISDEDRIKGTQLTVVPMDNVISVRKNIMTEKTVQKDVHVNEKEVVAESNDSDKSGLNASLCIEIHSSQESVEKTIVDKSNVDITASTPENTNVSPKKPFFTITGVVDGIRDELYHVPSVLSIQDGTGINSHNLAGSEHMELKYSDDDEWGMRNVVVELKHRMQQAFNPPPIYDQIQAVIYAQMYHTTEAEIVQVVRHTDENNDEKESKNDIETKPESEKKTRINITSSRISLDEPINRHRENWRNVVLPRLRSFVDAVYFTRSNDDKRYQLLRAATIASSGDDDSEWWGVLHSQCPWLLDCDTAFKLRRKM